MSTEATFRTREVSPRRLWFGLLAAVVCWLALLTVDILITWRACLHQEQFGGASGHPGLRALNIVLFLVLLAIGIVAGVLSYRNWQHLADEGKIYRAEANQPREYLAFLGVFISITLSIGMIWFGLPLLILSLCERTR